VGETGDPAVSRMTIVVRAGDYLLEQITKQLSKLVEVINITICPPHETVMRELALIKVRTGEHNLHQILESANIYRARIVDVSPESVVIEVTGSEDKIASLIRLLSPAGITELVRTGLTAMGRGCGTL